MALPTTLTDLKSALENTTGVVAVASDAPNNTDYSMQSILVKYLYSENNVVNEVSFVVFQKDDNTIFYYKRVPDILRDEPTERNFLLSKQQLRDKLEADNLTIDIVNITLQRRGNMDQATVEYIQNSLVHTDDYIIRQDDVKPWEPWTSGLNEDLYQSGNKVSHNGKIWEAVAGNNHWEPSDADPTLWIEVDPLDITYVNKRNNINKSNNKSNNVS